MTTEKNFPLVSIIIPVYNGANYLRHAINSALAQTYPNIEIIVINDGSTDSGKTEKIAKSYGNKIRYYHKENGGVSTAINLGIKKMKGEYFSWLSHDDIYSPNKIEVEINYLKEHRLINKKVILYSDYQVIDKNGKLLSTIIINHSLTEKHHLAAFMRGALNGNALLIPKSAWQEYGLLNPKLFCTQDYSKWLEMSKTYRFIHLPIPLVSTRYHAGQTTHTDPRVKTEGNDFWINVMKTQTHEERVKLSGNDYAYYYYLINHFKNTPYDEALSYCKKKIKEYPAPETTPPPENLITFKGNNMFSSNPLIKLFQLIKYEGPKNTITHIKHKLIKPSELK